MDNVSFKARINTNKYNIREGMIFDRFFADKTNKNVLKQTLRQVKNLSNLKEESTVTINPRLDSNQLNLITTVTDKTGKISTDIPERSARRMVENENFAHRFVDNIKQAIVNVEKVRKNIKLIDKTIKKSKTLQNDNFIERLPLYMIDNLNKNNNPTKRIVSVLKKIDKQYPNERNKISIQTRRNPKNHSKTTYFVLENSRGEKKIMIQNLLKDPMDNLFA